MDFSRGKQMFIFDTRVRARVPFVPPKAHHAWSVGFNEPVKKILDSMADAIDTDGTRMDAIHLIGQGSAGYLQIGAEGLTTRNTHLFEVLRDKTQTIVINVCGISSNLLPGEFNAGKYALGKAIAENTSATVIVGRNLRWLQNPYSDATRGFGVYDSEDQEGETFICYPDGNTEVISPGLSTTKSDLDLESYIFESCTDLEHGEEPWDEIIHITDPLPATFHIQQ